MKRAIIIYDTKYGNTERIARALAHGLEKQGVKVDSGKVDEIDVNKLVEYDFLAIGGPTHIRGISKPMTAFLEKLKGVDLKGKKAFAFDTKLNAWWAGGAGEEIENMLKELGMNIVKPHSSAIAMANEGPLEATAEETFEQIGVQIAELIP